MLYSNRCNKSNISVYSRLSQNLLYLQSKMVKMIERRYSNLNAEWSDPAQLTCFSIFHSGLRAKGNLLWVKRTKAKGIFRLWVESGWWHAFVGAELGKVLLTVHQRHLAQTWIPMPSCQHMESSAILPTHGIQRHLANTWVQAPSC